MAIVTNSRMRILANDLPFAVSGQAFLTNPTYWDNIFTYYSDRSSLVALLRNHIRASEAESLVTWTDFYTTLLGFY